MKQGPRNNPRIANRLPRHMRGLSFVEIMTVVAILAILAAVAWRFYDDQQLKNARADGVRGLGIASLAMENCLARRQIGYDACDAAGVVTTALQDANLKNQGGNLSPNGKYVVTVTAAGTTSFTLTAAKQGSADEDCGDLTLDNLGQKDRSGNFDAAIPVERCWSR